MTLIDTMKTLIPTTPDPPDPGVLNISNALEFAITTNIRATFLPGLGSIFLSQISSPTPFVISLATYLDSVLTPILVAAQSAQVSIGPVLAWASIQPLFDAISSPPPFMAGVFGSLFWLAVLITIRTAILPPPPSFDSSSDGESEREEVLRVDT